MKETRLEETIEIPEEIEAKVEGSIFTAKGKNGESMRDFKDPKIKIRKEGQKIFVYADNATKREKKKIGTFRAHIKNMLKGVSIGHTYILKICSGHFPMNVSIKENQFIVNNFLGEKVPRKLNIKEGANVSINGTEIVVKSNSKEVAGQVAADIEQLCIIKNRDRRIFQDGIFIINKDGKDI